MKVIGEPFYWDKKHRRVFNEVLECGHGANLRDADAPGPRRRKCRSCIGAPLREVVALRGRPPKEAGEKVVKKEEGAIGGNR